MKIQYFVFNYAHFHEAKDLLNRFLNEGLDAYLLSNEAPNDPEYEETDRVKKFSNIFYTGQWNEALKLFNADILFITNADVTINSIPELVSKMTNFYEKYKSDLYAPNHYWTSWTFDPNLLEDLEPNLKLVPMTDSTIWSISADIVQKVGQIDLDINKLGWGIEILAAWYCKQLGKYVVRDYSVKYKHPRSTKYNRHEADKQFRKMISSRGLGQEFWKYYNSRNKFGFGHYDV